MYSEGKVIGKSKKVKEASQSDVSYSLSSLKGLYRGLYRGLL